MNHENSITSEINIDKYRSFYYAAATNDFNPIHFDQQAAKDAGLDGVILHGMCILGFVSDAITEWTGDRGALKKIKCKFSNYVLSGDTIKIRGQINNSSDSKKKVDLTITNQKNEKILKRASAEIEI